MVEWPLESYSYEENLRRLSNEISGPASSPLFGLFLLTYKTAPGNGPAPLCRFARFALAGATGGMRPNIEFEAISNCRVNDWSRPGFHPNPKSSALYSILSEPSLDCGSNDKGELEALAQALALFIR